MFSYSQTKASTYAVVHSWNINTYKRVYKNKLYWFGFKICSQLYIAHYGFYQIYFSQQTKLQMEIIKLILTCYIWTGSLHTL